MRATPVLTAAVAAAAFASAPASAATVQCGQAITQSITVSNDLSNCPGDGLDVVGNNIVVDLGGHTIAPSTDSTGNGITVSGQGDAVRNGTVRNFVTGVFLGNSGNTLSRVNTVRDGSATPGLFYIGVLLLAPNQVTNSTQTGNDVGISVFSVNSVISYDLAKNNTVGVQVRQPEIPGLPAVFVTNSTFTGNGTGIDSSGGRVNLSYNTFTGNTDGIVDGFDNGSTIAANHVTGMGTDTGRGIAVHRTTNATLDGNQAVLTHFGFDLRGDFGTLARNNRAQRNGVGFRLRKSTSTLTANVAGSVSGQSGGTDGNGSGMQIGGDPDDIVSQDWSITLSGNSANNNTSGPDGPGNGIVVIGGFPCCSVVTGNTANFNAGNGIVYGGGFNPGSIKNNTARSNRGFGVVTDAHYRESPDGGGNHASSNVLGQCVGLLYDQNDTPLNPPQNALNCQP